MTNDQPITPEQALLAVKAAGLDPDKPLNERVGRRRDGSRRPSSVRARRQALILVPVGLELHQEATKSSSLSASD